MCPGDVPERLAEASYRFPQQLSLKSSMQLMPGLERKGDRIPLLLGQPVPGLDALEVQVLVVVRDGFGRPAQNFTDPWVETLQMADEFVPDAVTMVGEVEIGAIETGSQPVLAAVLF